MVDNAALLKRLHQAGQQLSVVLDASGEPEPDLNTELLARVGIAYRRLYP